MRAPANVTCRPIVTSNGTIGKARHLVDAAMELEGWPAIDVLRWAVDRFADRLVLTTAFGPGGCVLIDLVGRHGVAVEVITLDTSLFFEETYELWRRLEERYDLNIRRVTSAYTLSDQAGTYGDSLWEKNPDLCCAIRKIAPIKRELSRVDAWITSIRRSQTPQRAGTSVVEWDRGFEVAKINPLAHWSKERVWDYLCEHDVPFNPLHRQGYPSIGCWPCTKPVAGGEGDRSGRWKNWAKDECGLHLKPTSADCPVKALRELAADVRS